MQVLVRHGGLEDLARFTERLEEAGSWLWSREIRQREPGSHRSQRQRMARWIERGALLLRDCEDQTIGGCILIREQPQLWEERPEPATYFHKLAIGNGYRGSSLSRAIIEAAERWTTAHSLDRLRLNCWNGNTALHSLYGRLGFEEIADLPEGDFMLRLFEKSSSEFA